MKRYNIRATEDWSEGPVTKVTESPEGMWVLASDAADELARKEVGTNGLKLELEQAKVSIDNRNRVMNYWFPLLGYSCCNEMCYPALGDERAFPAPALEEDDLALDAAEKYSDDLENAIRWVAESSKRWKVLHQAMNPDERDFGYECGMLEYIQREMEKG